MATNVVSWRADCDHSLHRTEREATAHDLRDLAARIFGDEVERIHADRLANDAALAIRVLTAYVKAHPTEGGGRYALKAQKGPAKGAKPAPTEIMGCCRKPFSKCECDDAHLDRGRGQQP